MVYSTYKKHGRFLTVVFCLWLTSSFAFAQVILENENIIGERAAQKMEEMGRELQVKTGVRTHIVAISSLSGTPITIYEENLAKTLLPPYILLTLSKEDHQIDILASSDVVTRFDKESVLSPYPWSGTIIPLLTTKKGEDKYSAAMLNGYADIVEQVAHSYGVTLESGIGSANKNVLGLIRIGVYSSILLVIGTIIYRRVRKRYATK